MTLSSAGFRRGGDGPQGWACSVWHARLDVEELSVVGTVTAFDLLGVR